MGVKLVLTADYLKVDPLPQAKHLMLMKSPDFSRRVSPPLVRILSRKHHRSVQVKDLMVPPPPVHPFSFHSFILPLSLLKVPFFISQSDIASVLSPVHPLLNFITSLRLAQRATA